MRGVRGRPDALRNITEAFILPSIKEKQQANKERAGIYDKPSLARVDTFPGLPANIKHGFKRDMLPNLKVDDTWRSEENFKYDQFPHGSIERLKRKQDSADGWLNGFRERKICAAERVGAIIDRLRSKVHRLTSEIGTLEQEREVRRAASARAQLEGKCCSRALCITTCPGSGLSSIPPTEGEQQPAQNSNLLQVPGELVPPPPSSRSSMRSGSSSASSYRLESPAAWLPADAVLPKMLLDPVPLSSSSRRETPSAQSIQSKPKSKGKSKKRVRSRANSNRSVPSGLTSGASSRAVTPQQKRWK